MLKIGITGSIGSGKSTVCKIFETLGIPVYYADERGRLLMQNDQNVISHIIASFGKQILGSDQLPDRKLISEIVFKNPSMLSILEDIIHPAVFKDFNQWITQQKSAYVLKEAALLFEAGSYRELDKIVVVKAPLEARMTRVMKRDALTREQILAREQRQWPEAKKAKMADFVINNDDVHLIIPQITELHHKFMEMAKSNRLIMNN